MTGHCRHCATFSMLLTIMLNVVTILASVSAIGNDTDGDFFVCQVNNVNFENMSNDDAVRVLREIVHKPG